MNLAILPRFKQGTFNGIWGGNGYTTGGGSWVLMAQELGIGLTTIVTEYDFEKVCAVCDGLIVPGSPIDIDPTYYGGEPFDPPAIADEYALDRKVIDCFARQGKPMFGVCGGIQALNVFFGGTLKRVKDLRDTSVSETHRFLAEATDPRGNVIEYHVHAIDIEKDSFVYDVYGADSYTVNSYHSWAVDSLAPGFRIVAKSKDGIVEAIEWKEKYIFATQWHPELGFFINDAKEKQLFVNFLDCCRRVSQGQK